MREPSWDRLERHLGALADDHLNKWIDRSTFDLLVAACDADRVDRRLQQREHDGELPPNHTPATVRGLEDDSERLNHQVHDDHDEQRNRAKALPGEEQCDNLHSVRSHVADAERHAERQPQLQP